MDENTVDKLKAVFTVLVFLLFTYIVVQNAGVVKDLAQGYGLFGLFLAAAIANATVFLPMPIDIVILALNAQSSSLLEVIVLGIVVGSGAAIGEMTAYIAGLLGVQTAEKIKESEFVQIRKIREKIEHMGMWFIFLAALIPFPFDIIGITAGFIKYNPRKFFVAALFGKIGRFILLGLAAYYGFAAIKDLHLL